MAKEKKSAAWIMITPELAKEFLATSEGNPRYGASGKVVNGKAVRKMVSDLRSNKWFDTGEGIQFDWNGHLVNGHHRLTAIVQSGIQQEVLVVRGISPQAVPHIDSGSKRGLPQRLASYGYAPEIANGASVGALRLAVAFRKGAAFADSMAEEWFMDFINEHQRAYIFAYETARTLSKAVTSGAEFAHAIAEAYEGGVDPSLLKNFCDIVNSGRYSGDEETAAVALRDWRLTEPKTFNARNTKDRMVNSAAIQTYIARFVDGQPIVRRISRNQIAAVYSNQNMKDEYEWRQEED